MSLNGKLKALEQALVSPEAERPGYIEALTLQEAEALLAELPAGNYKLYLGGFGPSAWDKVDEQDTEYE